HAAARGRGRAPRLPPVRLPLRGPRHDQAGARGRGRGRRLVLRDAAAPAAGVRARRRARGLAARDRAGVAGEPDAADVPDARRRAAGARGGRPAPRDGRGVTPRALINRHRLWQVGADAVLIAFVWYAAFALRFDGDFTKHWNYETYWKRTIAIVV